MVIENMLEGYSPGSSVVRRRSIIPTTIMIARVRHAVDHENQILVGVVLIPSRMDKVRNRN